MGSLQRTVNRDPGPHLAELHLVRPNINPHFQGDLVLPVSRGTSWLTEFYRRCFFDSEIESIMIPWCISIISKCSLCLIHSINYCGINNMFPCSHRAEVESRHHHSLTTRSLQLPLSWLGTYSEGSTWFSPLTRVPSYSGCYKSCSLFR